MSHTGSIQLVLSRVTRIGREKDSQSREGLGSDEGLQGEERGIEGDRVVGNPRQVGGFE